MHPLDKNRGAGLPKPHATPLGREATPLLAGPTTGTTRLTRLRQAAAHLRGGWQILGSQCGRLPLRSDATILRRSVMELPNDRSRRHRRAVLRTHRHGPGRSRRSSISRCPGWTTANSTLNTANPRAWRSMTDASRAPVSTRRRGSGCVRSPARRPAMRMHPNFRNKRSAARQHGAGCGERSFRDPGGAASRHQPQPLCRGKSARHGRSRGQDTGCSPRSTLMPAAATRASAGHGVAEWGMAGGSDHSP